MPILTPMAKLPNKGDRDVFVGVVQGTLELMMAQVRVVNAVGAQLAVFIANVNTQVTARWIAGTLASDLLAIFVQAQQAGIGYDGLEVVRLYLLELPALNPFPQKVQQLLMQLTLARMATVIAGTTFASRQEIETALLRMGEAFDQAKVLMASELGAGNWLALVALEGAVMVDLTTRQRPLPLMIGYSVAAILPALALSAYLYNDGSRADELAAENNTPNPCFMPPSGFALSS
jgi:hypothetical protein